jgi:hypothetical protein
VSSRQHQSENWINEARRRLASMRGEKPETKAGQIWALWPEIKAAIEDGQSIKTIRLWLEEQAAIVVSSDSLRTYIRRCQAKEMARQTPAQSPVLMIGTSTESTPVKLAPIPAVPSGRARSLTSAKPEEVPNIANDPMAIARRAMSKPRFDIRKIHNDGDPTDQNLI